ncbi:hypothetical protein HK100_001313 [Physocladia obscura]|uniref:Uncharacterized protein n=1 Tax=Physocladia obscura TaxID=109957 RepID=A0AAD5SYR5_9FUNG|nr:hypothetical protein HK100_001313 [Physocladia obscura]
MRRSSKAVLSIVAASLFALCGAISLPNQAVVFGSDTPSAQAALISFATFGIPVITYDSATSTAFSTLPLLSVTTGTANFSMILLGSGVIGFSTNQWAQLYAYQSANNVRLASLYDVPGIGSSYGYTTSAVTAVVPVTVSPANVLGSTKAGLPSLYNFTVATGTVYPAKTVNATAVTPILNFTDSTGVTSIAACIYSFSATQQQLSFFYQTATWDGAISANTPTAFAASLSSYTNAVLINWLSNGTYALTAPPPPAPVVTHTAIVQTRALILSTGDGTDEYPAHILQAYGLDYDIVVANASGLVNTPLPLEVVQNVTGKYSLIVLASGQMIGGFPNGSYLTTLYSWQWKQLYNYQQYYGVRLVAINDLPTASLFANQLSSVGSAVSCNSQTSLYVSPANGSLQFTNPAGMKANWSLIAGDGIADGSCNFPGTIINSTSVTPVLSFGTTAGSNNSGVAAAVIDFGRNQQQMSFFFPCGSWSITCDTVGHLWFQWATYGLYTGIRRLYFTPQVDDMFLTTSGNNENGVEVDFRLSPADIQGLITWQPQINARLPAGSNITFEIGFNGNGVMEIISTSTDYSLDFDPDLTDSVIDWKKPLGTGQTLWPSLSTLNTNWGPVLASDPLYSFFAGANLTKTANKFLWCSHTFTHEILNNNSYSDTWNEVTFNFRLASKSYLGWDGQAFWNNKSMITPGISGLFNGDALRALSDFGIKAAVGDSSRPKTLHPTRPLYWPLNTTFDANGFDGFIIIPRQVLNIYFNATNQAYDTILYNTIYGLTGANAKSFYYVLNAEVQRNLRTLALLSWQPAMFHQGNLRNADMPVVSFGSATGKLGLAQQWIESVFGNFTQIVNWPIITVKQDDLTQKFINRQIYETAGVTVLQNRTVTAGGVYVVGFTVSANTSCSAPVTLPYGVTGQNLVLPTGATTEQIGVDSLTVWVPLIANAAPVSIKFGTSLEISVPVNSTV